MKEEDTFKLLIQNFEVEYIFSFLPLCEIVQHSRISKFFHKTLKADSLWEDLSLIHFDRKIQYDCYNKIKTLMMHPTLLAKDYKPEAGMYQYEPDPFYQDKLIKKVERNPSHLLVITEDGLFKINNGHQSVELFSNIKGIVDVVSDTYLNKNNGLILTKDQRVFKVEFENENYEELDWRTIIKDERATVSQIGINYRMNLILTSTGVLIEGNSTKDLKVRANEIQNIFPPGVVTKKNEFLSNAGIESNKKERHLKPNILEAQHLNTQGSLLFKMVDGTIISEDPKWDHTASLKKIGEVVDKYWVINVGVHHGEIVFRTKSKKFYIFGPDESNYIPTDELNIYPILIDEVYSSAVYVSIKGPVTKSAKKALVTFRESEEIRGKKIKEDTGICGKCDKKYGISENTDISCQYHASNKFFTKKMGWDEVDLYVCCNKEYSEGCVKKKHIFSKFAFE